eukprot:CAMPEP_0176010106 /NCGR_PEP_ID=MMETSP0120_2-20121206/4593_1 /TAXON_ID=160619 /ORGANISM="Kryptoperidinium foliaceum, Strain CCMP 1326" /LENGTH=393 /DNA_ID=CAMNT_0017342919 /DNA_START=27 /DNA_END=1205 /DNA_ORIENTATION=+
MDQDQGEKTENAFEDLEAPDAASNKKDDDGRQQNGAISISVADLTGTHPELLAHDDLFRSLEQQRKERLTKSSKNLALSFLVPSLPEDQTEDFLNMSTEQWKSNHPREELEDAVDEDDNVEVDEDEAELTEEVHNQREDKARKSLRSLTAQIITANRALKGMNKNSGLKEATKGTPSDRMAEQAEVIFASTSKKTPDGISFDETGKPVLKRMKPLIHKETIAGVSSPSSSVSPTNLTRKEAKRLLHKTLRAQREEIENNQQLFVDFIRPRKSFLCQYWWIRLKFFVIPGVALAALLYYAFGNPPHGYLNRQPEGHFADRDGRIPLTPSASWWILFLVRQVVTHASAKLWELFLVDFLAIKTRILQSLVGPYVSLWIAQSKGWPFRAIVWGVTN